MTRGPSCYRACVLENVAAAPPAVVVPPLWKRVLLMPFLPSLWADARNWPLGAVVVPLFLSATLWSGALATYRGIEFRGLLNGLATDWDSKFDPLVIEDGVARVEGTRLPEGGDEKTLMLADPEETRPAPTDKRYMILRKRSVIRGDGPPVNLADVQRMLGSSTIRIDGSSMRAWLSQWGLVVQLSLLALLVGFEWIGVVFGLVYGVIAGAALISLVGKSRALTAQHCSRVGMAVLAVKPVLGVVLGLLGMSVHACLGLIVWPVLAIVLGAIALSRLPTSAPQE